MIQTTFYFFKPNSQIFTRSLLSIFYTKPFFGNEHPSKNTVTKVFFPIKIMSLVERINDPNYILLITSFISIISSILILRYVSTKKRMERIYNRLVFMLALVDLIYTFHLCVFSVTIRKKNRQIDALCNYEGFIHTAMVLPSMYYNCFLSIFFLHSIHYNDKKPLKRLEPFIHCLCILIPIMVASLNLFFGVYGPGNPDKYSCYVIIPNDPPLKCDDKGFCYNPYDKSTLIAAYVLSWFQILSGIATFLLLSVNSYLILQKARELSKANERHTSEAFDGNLSSRKLRRKQTAQHSAGHKNVIQIRNQSLLYVGGFSMIYYSVLILNIACAVNAQQWGPFADYLPADIVRLLFDTSYPLSGLYTALVFFRPRYLRWRYLNQSRSWLFIIQLTVFSKVAPYKVSKKHNPSNEPKIASKSRRFAASFHRNIVEQDDVRISDNSEPVKIGNEENIQDTEQTIP
jgi:hypothetical protein